MDVGSASDAFTDVVTVGLNATDGIPSGWYSDGSLIKLSNKYYPFNNTDKQYYDYDRQRLMYYDDDDHDWYTRAVNPSIFDQVPADFISYLQSGNFTLVQG